MSEPVSLCPFKIGSNVKTFGDNPLKGVAVEISGFMVKVAQEDGFLWFHWDDLEVDSKVTYNVPVQIC